MPVGSSPTTHLDPLRPTPEVNGVRVAPPAASTRSAHRLAAVSQSHRGGREPPMGSPTPTGMTHQDRSDDYFTVMAFVTVTPALPFSLGTKDATTV